MIHARHRLSVKEKKPRARTVREPAATYRSTSDRFDWKDTGFLLRVPMIRALFNHIVHSRELEKLTSIWPHPLIARTAVAKAKAMHNPRNKLF